MKNILRLLVGNHRNDYNGRHRWGISVEYMLRQLDLERACA